MTMQQYNICYYMYKLVGIYMFILLTWHICYSQQSIKYILATSAYADMAIIESPEEFQST